MIDSLSHRCMAALCTFFALATRSPAAGKTLDIAVLESLKANQTADWTQTAADEYELGLRAGSELCSYQDGVNVHLTRYYFAGKDDPDFRTIVEAATSKRHDLIIGPGNHDNIIPAIKGLAASKVISPLARGRDVIEGIVDFVPMHKPDELIVKKILPFLVAKGTKKIIAVYDPMRLESVSVRNLFQAAALAAAVPFASYPMASFSDSEVKIAAQRLGAMTDSSVEFRTIVIAPFGTKDLLALTSAFQAGHFNATTIGFGLPPQFAKLAKSNGVTIPLYDVRLYDQSFLNLDQSNNWYTKLMSRMKLRPKTPLPFFVSAAMKKVCDEYSVVKSDWQLFRLKQLRDLQKSDLWLARIADGQEAFIKL